MFVEKILTLKSNLQPMIKLTLFRKYTNFFDKCLMDKILHDAMLSMPIIREYMWCYLTLNQKH